MLFQPRDTALKLFDFVAATGITRFDSGDEQCICLILLGPETIRIKPQELPEQALERYEQEGEPPSPFMDLEIGKIYRSRFTEAFEVECQEFVGTSQVGEVGSFRARDSGIRVCALRGLRSDRLADLADDVVDINAFRADRKNIISHARIIERGHNGVKPGAAGAEWRSDKMRLA